MYLLSHSLFLSLSLSLQRMLPPLRHTYIVPFVPSGFWPRLMSRLLSDKSILQLAREGCNITEDGRQWERERERERERESSFLSLSLPPSLFPDATQLNWVKWREGLILQYGNLTLMTVEELKSGLFPTAAEQRGMGRKMGSRQVSEWRGGRR